MTLNHNMPGTTKYNSQLDSPYVPVPYTSDNDIGVTKFSHWLEKTVRGL